jgi:chromosome segregation ATPase
MSQRTSTASAAVHVENIGGITEVDVELAPGTTLLTGHNATNRTSFLRAVMAVCGSDDVAIKSDADEGSVSLDLDGETYFRRLSRQGRGTTLDGEPYLEDATVADLFAFLLESNDARQAVVNHDNLRELIIRPIDTEAIESRIRDLQTERDRLDDRLDSLSDLEDERHRLELRRDELEDRIDELETRREELEVKIEAAESSVDAEQESQRELESVLEDLQSVQSEIEQVRFRIETERESIESLREEQQEVNDTLDSLEPIETGDDPSMHISQLRSHIEDLNETITELQTIVQFNSEALEGSRIDVVEEAFDTDDDEALTDQLVDTNEVRCWTCGSEVDRTQIEETTAQLRELRNTKRERREELRSELEEAIEARNERKQRAERRSELENRQARIDAELEQRTSDISELEEKRDSLIEDAERLEDRAESLRDQTQADLLDSHTELNQCEFSLEQCYDERAEIDEELADIESELSQREDLREQREQATEALQDARTRIKDIETAAVDSFNQEMADVIDLLAYENIERVWLERVEQSVRKGRQTVSEGRFELHIVRESAAGTAYEDTIDHLSESEREVIGLVFALAGYLVHEVYKTIPFMLLDSVEALDAPRIGRLIDHFEQYPTFLIVALLSEDAQALEASYDRVTWD